MPHLKKIISFVIGVCVFFVCTYAFRACAASKSDGDYLRALDAMIPAESERNNFNFTKTVIALTTLIDPDMDTAWTMNELDLLASRLKQEIGDEADPELIMKKFNAYLFQQQGFVFNEGANSLFDKTDEAKATAINSLVDFNSIYRVLKLRQGICLSLSVLCLIEAEKLNLPLYGIIVPGHMYVRYQSRDARRSGINAETTFGGFEAYKYDELTGTEFLKKGATAYNRPLDKYSMLGAVLNNYGIIFLAAGHLKKAGMIFEKAIAILPDLPETHSNMGLVLQSQKKYSLAEEQFGKSLELFSGYAAAYTNLGYLYMDTGRPGQAKESFEKALSLDPEDARAQKGLALKNRGGRNGG